MSTLDLTAKKACATCQFQALEQMQGQIQRVMVCHRFPPHLSMVAVPQGIQGQTMFPVVQPHMWCYEWLSKDPEQQSFVAPADPASSP